MEVKRLDPLPPIEYCRIEKAAGLLNCGIDDLIHWGAIGAISLGIKVSDLSGILLVDQSVNPRVEDVVNMFDSIDLQKELLGKYSEFLIPFGDYDPLAQDKDDLEKGIFCFKGMANGIWGIPGKIIEGIENFGRFECLYHHDDKTSASIILSPMFNPDEDFKLFMSYPEKDWNITGRDLWITRADLVLLHSSLLNNEELPNRHTSTRKESEGRKKIENAFINNYKPRTPHESIMVALGIMACLFAEKDGYSWGSKPNAKAIALKVEDKAIDYLGNYFEELKLSNLRKDISAAVNFITDKIIHK